MTTGLFKRVVWLLLPRTQGPQKDFRRFVCGFGHSGELEFLSRFFPKPTTGKITYYNGATFRGDDLQTLQAALLRAREALAQQPDEWEEELNDPGLPEHDEHAVVVRKKDIEETIEDFLWAIDRAFLDKGFIEFGHH